MVSMQFCVIGLAVLVFPQSVAHGYGDEDESQDLKTTLHNMDRRVKTHTAILTEMERELAALKAKRCETGQVYLTPHDKPVVTIPAGYQVRLHKVHVDFTRSFSTIPWVSVGFNRLDVFNTDNIRIDGSAEAVTTSGFDAVGFEWSSTHVFQSRISWVACNV